MPSIHVVAACLVITTNDDETNVLRPAHSSTEVHPLCISIIILQALRFCMPMYVVEQESQVVCRRRCHSDIHRAFACVPSTFSLPYNDEARQLPQSSRVILLRGGLPIIPHPARRSPAFPCEKCFRSSSSDPRIANGRARAWKHLAGLIVLQDHPFDSLSLPPVAFPGPGYCVS